MSNYITTIGLEIHAELKTKTKMFCNSPNNPDEKDPNVNTCPICLGHPGTLPTLNKEAIKHVLKIGYAIKADIADYTEWDRKNYFYPDIPKGYQISQYKYPLVAGGQINGVDITRIHLEEDTGTSTHDQGNYSLINYNRAGVPLMELVTEPVIHSAKEAVDFARELQLLLKYMKVSDANMEKGEMRVEVNISIALEGSKELGTKVEIKNLNSFRVAEKAILYEVKRMTKLLDAGEDKKIIQETRGWDEVKQKTFSQRVKENSDDYRYFPEPDLPKLYISQIPEFAEKELCADFPELPWERRNRLVDLGLNSDQVEVFMYNDLLFQIFDGSLSSLKDSKKIKLAANYLTTDLVAIDKGGDSNVSSAQIVELIQMISVGEISSRGAKDLLAILVNEKIDGGYSIKDLAKDRNLIQESDEGALKEVVIKIIKDNQQAVDEYKKGKEASLQFLIGQGMKETKGSANPQSLSSLFKELI